MSVRVSQPNDVPALKALWKAAFGDEDGCVDAFFRTVYRPENVFVACGDEAVRAMACWLPMTICWSGRGWPAAYLYAVATDAAHRGRGCCGRLLAFAEGFLAPRGYKALLLVPGGPSLRGFYARHGYHDFTTLDRFELEAGPTEGGAEPVAPPVYLELREQFLAHRPYVSCPVPVLSYQEAIARLYGGGLYRLTRGDCEGCACAALDREGRAVVYELLWPGGRQEGADLIAAALGASRALVRTPGGAEPFAMAKWLVEKPKLPAPYLGIALD